MLLLKRLNDTALAVFGFHPYIILGGFARVHVIESEYS
jgi:hypothetical protein